MAKAASVKSKLFSPSDIQSIMKKAMVERLRGKYGIKWFEETGASYPVRVSYENTVTVDLDTTGYRFIERISPGGGKAPIAKESGGGAYAHSVEKDRILVDPFAGSSTFPIEAAMITANITQE